MATTIEVSVLKPDGSVADTQTMDAVLTDAFAKQGLFSMLRSNAVDVTGDKNSGELLRLEFNRNGSNIEFNEGSNNVTGPLQNGTYGIYALKNYIDIKPDMYGWEFLGRNMRTLGDNVVFYNINGAKPSIEDAVTLVPNDIRCFGGVKKGEASYTLEYIKDNGEGTISSVIIGKNFSTYPTTSSGLTTSFSLFQSVVEEPSVFSNFTGVTRDGYYLEHGEDYSIIYKCISSTAMKSFNFKTKEILLYPYDAALRSQTVSAPYSNGIVIGDHVYKADSVRTTAYNRTIPLMYKGTKNNTDAPARIDILVPDSGVGSIETMATPVSVYNYDTDKLEIFIADYRLPVGDDFGNGWFIRKIVIDPNVYPITNNDYTIEDVGPSKYMIGSYNYASGFAGTATNYIGYSTGLYVNERYYMPIRQFYNDQTSVIDATALSNTTVANYNYSEGAVFNSDFSEVLDFFNNGNQNFNIQPVITDDGVKSIVPNIERFPYIFNSNAMCAVNFPTPIVKGPDDLLRIRVKIGI